jgi:hypothetical protein
MEIGVVNAMPACVFVYTEEKKGITLYVKLLYRITQQQPHHPPPHVECSFSIEQYHRFVCRRKHLLESANLSVTGSGVANHKL